MTTYQCKVCGGVYLDPQEDGSRYFHSCPRARNPAYDAQFVIDGDGNHVPKGTVDPKIPRTLVRAGGRNENVEVKPDGKTEPKTDGAGKDTLP